MFLGGLLGGEKESLRFDWQQLAGRESAPFTPQGMKDKVNSLALQPRMSWADSMWLEVLKE